MRCRCPHCQNPIELVADDSLTNIECDSCGSHFELLSDQATVDYRGSRQFAHFELLSKVGTGRFGSVWKARDTKLDRIVAVKIPRLEALEEKDKEQFFREARAAAQVKHQNIVGVHEVGKQEQTVYIVSDFIDGANLKEYIASQRLTFREVAELCVTVAGALQAAHDAGTVRKETTGYPPRSNPTTRLAWTTDRKMNDNACWPQSVSPRSLRFWQLAEASKFWHDTTNVTNKLMKRVFTMANRLKYTAAFVAGISVAMAVVFLKGEFSRPRAIVGPSEGIGLKWRIERQQRIENIKDLEGRIRELETEKVLDSAATSNATSNAASNEVLVAHMLRMVNKMSFRELVAESGLVVIASAAKTVVTENTDEFDEDVLDQVETQLNIHMVLRGKFEERTIRLVHFRQKKAVSMMNGPQLIEFETEKATPPTFLLFLKRRADGKFELTSGQVDPIYSAFRLSRLAE